MLITEDSLHIYQTLDGRFRAYVKGSPSLQAYGHSRVRAIFNLAKILSDADLSFDFTETAELNHHKT